MESPGHIKSVDLLSWWNDRQDLPGLSILAKSIFSIPATSASAERAISTAGQILTAHRSCLNPDHFESCMILSRNSEISNTRYIN